MSETLTYLSTSTEHWHHFYKKEDWGCKTWVAIETEKVCHLETNRMKGDTSESRPFSCCESCRRLSVEDSGLQGNADKAFSANLTVDMQKHGFLRRPINIYIFTNIILILYKLLYCYIASMIGKNMKFVVWLHKNVQIQSNKHPPVFLL